MWSSLAWALVIPFFGLRLFSALLRFVIRRNSTHARILAHYKEKHPTFTPSGVSLADVLRQFLPFARFEPTDIRFVGFFHPYCNAGGGGERVLWCAVNALHAAYPNAHAIIYTGKTADTSDRIIQGAKDLFGVTVDASRVDFVFLSRRHWVEADRYPRFTMIGQSLGSIVLALEALLSFVPDVYIDTMGYAFTFPIFSILAHSHIACYVHYPTISTDMLTKVQSGVDSFNNAKFIARSKILTSLKYYYYAIFAYFYGMVGRYAKVVLVNSSWTEHHIVSLWGVSSRTHIVYPPCDTKTFEAFPLQPRKKIVMSLSQFRPEKNQALQITSFARFLRENKQHQGKVKLILAGGCRNKQDEERVNELIKLRNSLNLTEQDVEVRTNIPFSELKSLLMSSLIGIHTMKEEHFGIGVVEFMAAGVLTLASNSGGPKSDIVVPYDNKITGWLALTEEEYSNSIALIINLSEKEQLQVQEKARQSVSGRFSESTFESDFVRLMKPVLQTI